MQDKDLTDRTVAEIYAVVVEPEDLVVTLEPFQAVNHLHHEVGVI